MRLGKDGILYYKFWLPQNVGPYNPKYHTILKDYGMVDTEDDNACDALEIQFVQDFPPKTGLEAEGWLLPDGKFFPCLPAEHDSMANYIYKYVYRKVPYDYEEVSFIKHVENLGWIRITRNFAATPEDKMPTNEQIETLYDLYILSDSEKFRRYLKYDFERWNEIRLGKIL